MVPGTRKASHDDVKKAFDSLFQSWSSPPPADPVEAEWKRVCPEERALILADRLKYLHRLSKHSETIIVLTRARIGDWRQIRALLKKLVLLACSYDTDHGEKTARLARLSLSVAEGARSLAKAIRDLAFLAKQSDSVIDGALSDPLMLLAESGWPIDSESIVNLPEYPDLPAALDRLAEMGAAQRLVYPVPFSSSFPAERPSKIALIRHVLKGLRRRRRDRFPTPNLSDNSLAGLLSALLDQEFSEDDIQNYRRKHGNEKTP